jgi:hypothetical protein
MTDHQVNVLEDDPVFDAGTGSCLTADGTVEMDAVVMDGHSLKTGAVVKKQRLFSICISSGMCVSRTSCLFTALRTPRPGRDSKRAPPGERSPRRDGPNGPLPPCRARCGLVRGRPKVRALQTRRLGAFELEVSFDLFSTYQ